MMFVLHLLCFVCYVDTVHDKRVYDKQAPWMDFYLGFLDNNGPNGYVQLNIVANDSGSCIINIPFFNISETIAINGSSKNIYNISKDIEMNITGIEMKGVKVSCDIDVSIYAMNYYMAYSEGYLAIPYKSLGRRYIAATYSNINFTIIMLNNVSVGVVCTENNTTVTLFLKIKNGVLYFGGHAYQSNDSLTVNLNAYETFYFSNTHDLSGTIITSTKPVAVVSGGDISINRSSQYTDYTTEMILPSEQLGKDFVVPLLYDSFCLYRVLADDDATVTIQNSTSRNTKTLVKGEFLEISNFTTSTVESSTGVLVQLYCAKLYSTCNYAMTTVPSIQHFKTSYQFTVVSNYPLDRFPPDNFFITIIITADDKHDLILDGVKGIMFNEKSTIKLAGKKYSILSHELDVGIHEMHHADSVPFGLIVYGRNPLDGYAYPAGLKMNPQ
ncbi:IgGFc-binding protein-like [Mytilus edulis]|uniref:IgGFc-binding protein-like n=1 Tax=Mytilus edulis TaxID=6550 RepID=UPI0039F08150